MTYASHWDDEGRFNVSVWIDDETGESTERFNLSDHTGEHSTRTAKFRGLAPDLRDAIKGAIVKAKREATAKRVSALASREATARLFREDMVRYCEPSDAYGIVERGLAGTCYCHAKDCAELPTFDALSTSRARGHAYDSRISCYFGCLVDGGMVVDKTATLERSPGRAVSAPLLETSLVSADRFADIAGDAWILGPLSDPESFGAVATLAKVALVDRTSVAFDKVPMSEYVQWWREHGARIGKREGDIMVWEDGEREPIRPVSARWMASH